MTILVTGATCAVCGECSLRTASGYQSACFRNSGIARSPNFFSTAANAVPGSICQRYTRRGAINNLPGGGGGGFGRGGGLGGGPGGFGIDMSIGG